jgi:DNA-directed RNA polymerase subunit RPC12/RpoP
MSPADEFAAAAVRAHGQILCLVKCEGRSPGAARKENAGLRPELENGMFAPQAPIVLAMSEFKYACPVCGQHIKCDSTQGGTTMECPTCFQKIIVPQAPATEDQKFILHGTKVGAERPLPAAVANVEPLPSPAPEVRSSRAPAIFLAVVVFAAAILLYAFHGTLFRTPGQRLPPKPGTAGQPGRPPAPPKPAVVAPPADDALWRLNLEQASIPATPVAGRIHGLDFIIERASFQNGTLTLRRGTRGPVDFGLTVNFSGALAEALSAQTIQVTTNTEEAARVTLRWSSDASSGRDSYNAGYAMRLEFGPLESGRLPGRIYLCTPDADKSYLVGAFTAEVRKPRPATPQ